MRKRSSQGGEGQLSPGTWDHPGIGFSGEFLRTSRGIVVCLGFSFYALEREGEQRVYRDGESPVCRQAS
ncbi:MAG TPA: hypothetical protein VNS63_05140 [Blastocatellia bacterium]|nr:hypothetical protein [Blastocatellia bacterium]